MRFRPRPAEIVLLSFVGYCLVRAAAGRTLSVATPNALPRGDVLITLFFVLTIRLALEYRDTPWPPDFAAQKRLHSLFFVAFLLVGVLPGLVVYLSLPQYVPHVMRDGGTVARSLLFVFSCLRALLAFAVPGAFFWLAMGLYIKRHGRFTLRGLFVESAGPAVDVLRDWAPPLGLIYCYVALGPLLSQRLVPDRDETLAHIDRVLFMGHSPGQLCEGIMSAPLSEWLSGCYTFYLPLFPLVLGALFAMRQRAPFRETAFALSVVLAVGYVGYAMVPAIGPVFLETFDRPLDLYYTGWLKTQLMDRTRVPRDCFPSLHTGASLTLLWGSRHLPKLAWGLLPIVGSIPFACVYLRYHYVTDVLAGLLLFLAVATWTSKSRALQAAFRR